tara:strand:- start:50 stop:592 length:543 start_codon:yes stop_codon:yes gene_type:complete
MASGYIEYSSSTGTLVSSSGYVAFALTTPADPNSNDAIPLPTSGCIWEYLEIVIKEDNENLTGTGATSTVAADHINMFLSWDINGVYKIAGSAYDTTPYDLHLVTVADAEVDDGLTTDVEFKSTAMDIGIAPTFPISNPAELVAAKKPARKTIYCHVKTDSGTKDVLILARLFWREFSKG